MNRRKTGCVKRQQQGVVIHIQQVPDYRNGFAFARYDFGFRQCYFHVSRIIGSAREGKRLPLTIVQTKPPFDPVPENTVFLR